MLWWRWTGVCGTTRVLVKNSGYVHPDEMTLPLLFFTQGAISLEEQAKDFASKDNDGPNVLNAWTHGDLITVDDMALTHVEHSSMFQRNEEIWKHYPENRKGDYSRAEGIVGYGWAARYTLEFLNAYLKHDAAATAFPEEDPSGEWRSAAHDVCRLPCGERGAGNI